MKEEQCKNYQKHPQIKKNNFTKNNMYNFTMYNMYSKSYMQLTVLMEL